VRIDLKLFLQTYYIDVTRYSVAHPTTFNLTIDLTFYVTFASWPVPDLLSTNGALLPQRRGSGAEADQPGNRETAAEG